MGSDAAIYPFDFERYQHHIVPAIKRLLLYGQTTGWLQALIDAINIQLPEKNGTDLEQFCHYLDANLAWNTIYDKSDMWHEDWDFRNCKSTNCPERLRCLYHQNSDGTMAEELNSLIEAAVAALCVDEGQFVGRTLRVTKYWELLTQLNVPENDPLHRLLLKLGKRGFVIGYQWAGSAEGIHGWLNAIETQELAHRLRDLSLPRLPASFEGIQQALVSFRNQPGDQMAFAVLSLGMVGAVAAIAANRQKGILWANDLINHPGYLPDHISLAM
jgi:hypothetical protein